MISSFLAAIPHAMSTGARGTAAQTTTAGTSVQRDNTGIILKGLCPIQPFLYIPEKPVHESAFFSPFWELLWKL